MSDDPTARFEKELAEVEGRFQPELEAATGEQTLREINARFVGPQGVLTRLMKSIREVPADRRRELGQRANQVKNELQRAFRIALARFERAAQEAELSGPPLDVTLPGRRARSGGLHPITRVRHELLDIFESFGFDVVEGPEADLYEYNFDKLGFPPDHPATDMQDSFFLRTEGEKVLLRTHTSTIQVREMLRRPPPLAICAPGAVYRRDDDVTHSPMFFQLEGLLVDRSVSFAHLRGTLARFAQRMFGPEVAIRIRPSYFPFVEPGGEVDVACTLCRPWEGHAERVAACRVCKGSGWLEILGCGMVHPVVFESVGYDPTQFTGFAFGMGIDRVAMLKYGIRDIRMLYENDMRFLSQL